MWIFFLLFLTFLFASKYLFLTARKKHLPVNGKVVFITGCDSGIGYDLAKHLDNLGFVVFAGCLLPDDQGAKRLQKESSDRLTIIGIDVTNEASVHHAVDLVQSSLSNEKKELWALINNAGVLVYGEFDWQTWNQCHKQIDVNLLGMMRVTKNFLPMIKKYKTRIITVTSVNGKVSYPGTSVYSATKFALEGFCAALRFEMSKFGVKVIVVAPGDHSKLTNIMQQHRQNMTEMWDSMSTEQKEYYSLYFEKLNQRLLNPKRTNNTWDMSVVMADLLDAVIAVQPKLRYVSAPLGFKILFAILLSLPGSLSDKLLSILFKVAFKFEKECKQQAS